MSTKGSDIDGIGTAEKPFATPAKAVEKFAAAKSGAFVIKVLAGEYFFDKSLELNLKKTDGKRLSVVGIPSSDGSKPRFVGGVKIPATALQKVEDKSILDRIPPNARKKLYFANLKKFGVSDCGKVVARGWSAHPDPEFEVQAFFNLKAMTLAKYPNDKSLLKIGEVIDRGSITEIVGTPDFKVKNVDKIKRGAIFKYAYDRPDRWLSAENAFVAGNLSVGWGYDEIGIKKIDPAAKTIELATHHAFGVYSNDVPKKNAKYVEYADIEKRGYCVFNLLEELDTRGEYFIDRKNCLFYTILENPPKDGDAYYFATLSTPILNLRDARFATFRNIEFAVSRGSPVEGSFCRDISFERCIFRACGSPVKILGTSYKKEDDKSESFVKNLRFLDCDFCENLYGGLLIGGGNKRLLSPSEIVVADCRFRDNSLRRYKSHLQIAQSVGVKIANNDFYDSPKQAIVVEGNNVLIEKNVFANCCSDISDMGVIYTFSNRLNFGNVVRLNFFKNNVARDKKSMVAGVYMDESAAGWKVKNNIFFNTGSRFGATYVHGGCENRVEGNVFINLARAFSNSVWKKERYARKLELQKPWVEKSVGLDSEIYRKAYPSMGAILDVESDAPRFNYLSDNAVFNANLVFNGNAIMSNNRVLAPDSPAAAPEIRAKKDISLGEIKKYFGGDTLVSRILRERIGSKK